ncbi:hypothetical protein ATO13_10746 [Stappia sp. 22II-S9-Z10]|nr:hypothetical protein ATO13_10746 [Stappia sp. 22II-S9-Z10]
MTARNTRTMIVRTAVAAAVVFVTAMGAEMTRPAEASPATASSLGAQAPGSKPAKHPVPAAKPGR